MENVTQLLYEAWIPKLTAFQIILFTVNKIRIKTKYDKAFNFLLHSFQDNENLEIISSIPL